MHVFTFSTEYIGDDITEIQVFTDVGRGGGVALLSGTSMQIKDSMVNEGVTSLIANEAFRGGGLYLEEATSLNIGTDDNNEGLIEVSHNHAKVREWLLVVVAVLSVVVCCLMAVDG